MARSIPPRAAPRTPSSAQPIDSARTVRSLSFFCPYFRLNSNTITVPGGAVITATLAECITSCDNTPGCVDVSWAVPGRGDSTGVCYKKSKIMDVRFNPNIWGARKISSCTSSKLKFHRKRVARSKPIERKQPSLKLKHLDKRYGIAYGPDVTFIRKTLIVPTTSTFTATSTR